MELITLIGYITIIVIFINIFIMNERVGLTLGYILVSAALVVIIVAILIYNSKNANSNKEHYANQPSGSNSLDQILSLIGLSNGQSSKSSDIANSLSNSDYTETLDSISTGLTLYYTAFSKESYPKNGKLWYNIAPFFANGGDTNCTDTSLSDTNAQFSQSVAYSRENGFTFGAASIMGPKGYQLGISGNGSFTIFSTVKFSAFDSTSANDFEFLKIPANTANNNGLTLKFSNNVTQIGSLYGVNVSMQFGTQTIAAKDPLTDSTLIMINPAYTYFVIITKNNLDISLALYPNIDNISTNSQSVLRLVKTWKVDPSEEVLFSNKELLINRNRNVYGNLYNFGIYNKALDEANVSTLFMHTQTELQKSNQVLTNLAQQISKLQNQLQGAKACPYDESVCSSCKKITDWSNFTNIVYNGDEACLGSIDNYCSNNPKDDKCVCWDNTNALSQSNGCKLYVSMFKNGSSMVDAIDASTLEGIKKKHNLCSCDQASCNTDSNDPLSQISAPAKRVNTQFQINIDDTYSVNQDDLAVYEKGIVNYFELSDREIANIKDI